MNRHYRLTLATGFALLAGCDAVDEASSTDPAVSRIAGTIAQGRPGRWAEVCIDSRCTRADNRGDFQLETPLHARSLMQATLPEVDGTKRVLYGLLDPTAEQTTYLANANPTTNALIDAWSHYQQGVGLNDCLDSSGCATAVLEGFDATRRDTAVAFLATWLAPAWETERDPFSDPYRADPALDWLDRFHDHFHLVNDATSLALRDNNSSTLALVSHTDLFNADATPEPIAASLAEAALAIPPTEPASVEVISIDWEAEPSLILDAPSPFTLDASTSQSDVPGPLTIQLDWTTPQGQLTRFDQASASVDIEESGNHSWVITVIDSAGNRLSEGLTLAATRADAVSNPQYGADGSCQTTAMTANAANLCEETVDGGLLGACTPTNSGQTLTVKTPAPCSPISQNGGEFLGICTSVINELRVFHYDNPLRNTGETLAEQRQREAQRCAAVLGSSWSESP